ncbi:SOS response-associated peptidase [Kineococcus arenarius]|uniref:SOS response-associated peptidase n=1 Tax=unclassified Kineococcus TaxID=2621656 RepID=UPI003D7C9F70
MCERYVLQRDVDELVAEFEVEEPALGPGGAAPPADVVPGARPPVVLERFRKGEPDAPPSRSLRALSWGLVPPGARDASAGPAAAHVRAETLLREPSSAPAALARRCLVPVDSWYQRRAGAAAGDEPRGAASAVSAADGSVLSLAGVYEFWQDPARAPGDPARWLVSFAVVTTAAEPGPDRPPGRVPLVVPRDLRDAWLDPTLDEAEDVAALLDALSRERAATALRTHPVPPPGA